MSGQVPVHLVLVGFRGAGKTSVGRVLSGRLGWAFIDTDEIVMTDSGLSIADLFAAEGETGFRKREVEAIKRAVATEPAIISAGGGAVLDEDNMRRLKARGAVIWLRAQAETLAARIEGDPLTRDKRPRLTNKNRRAEVRALLTQREPIYQRWADLEISTEGRSVEAVSDEIIAWWIPRRVNAPPDT